MECFTAEIPFRLIRLLFFLGHKIKVLPVLKNAKHDSCHLAYLKCTFN